VDAAGQALGMRKPVSSSTTREVLPGVVAQVIVYLGPTTEVTSDYASWPAGSALRFGAYSVVLTGVSSSERRLLFNECGLVPEPAAGKDPYYSMTRLTADDLLSFSGVLDGRPYFDLDVEVAPAGDLTWGEVRTKSDLIVSATARDFGPAVSSEAER
jgi:hypothetical protein